MTKNNKLKTIFHTVVFAYVYLMIALTIPTNYGVVTPYKTRVANTMIEIDGTLQSTNFHTVSVLSMDRIIGFARIIYELNPEFEIYQLSTLESQLTLTENMARSQIQKTASFEQALITAYELASEIDNSIVIDYDFLGMMIDYREKRFSNLNIGDMIIDINHQGFDSYEDIGLYFINNNGQFTLTIRRNNQVFDVNIIKSNTDVFRFYPKYDIKSATPNYSLPGQHIISGGPSAGMMYTLSIYFGLIGYDKINLDIVGTGTIRYNQTIGQIGGLRQKIYTAHKAGINHFLLPASQYGEVSDLASLINLYPVETIDDAMGVIYAIFD